MWPSPHILRQLQETSLPLRDQPHAIGSRRGWGFIVGRAIPHGLHPASRDRADRLYLEQEGGAWSAVQRIRRIAHDHRPDPKRMGAKVGLTSDLYSWGAAMIHHPHVHMIVPGGGLSSYGNQWIACNSGFLISDINYRNSLILPCIQIALHRNFQSGVWIQSQTVVYFSHWSVHFFRENAEDGLGRLKLNPRLHPKALLFSASLRCCGTGLRVWRNW